LRLLAHPLQRRPAPPGFDLHVQPGCAAQVGARAADHFGVGPAVGPPGGGDQPLGFCGAPSAACDGGHHAASACPGAGSPAGSASGGAAVCGQSSTTSPSTVSGMVRSIASAAALVRTCSSLATAW